MFFEGSEKKVEIIVNEQIDLLSFDMAFWEELVAASHATILSTIENDKARAFLLSESSLFVWKDRLVLITCGQTTLVSAIQYFLSKLDKKDIASLIFQRKNEYFSHLQKTSFLDDIKLLEKDITGKAYRFGKMHDHHNFMYCSTSPFEASGEDKTLEVLMYDISEEASRVFNRTHKDTAEIREFLKFDELFPEYIIDDFAFSPQGYSVNALKGEYYFTIHITPEELNSYISFETNDNFGAESLALLLKILNPEHFDLISFNHEEVLEVPASYSNRTIISEKIDLGYNVIFSHFYNEDTVNERPYVLNLEEIK